MARRERGTVGRAGMAERRARTGRHGAVSDTGTARDLDRPGLGRHRSAEVAGPAGRAAPRTRAGGAGPPAHRGTVGRRTTPPPGAPGGRARAPPPPPPLRATRPQP